ncbi:hypothetical protein QYM36_000821 [Artemia franciscana]|uniref:Uncharacterized protein n=1 Tax=Artemia franciscana TaxID=6661 RepID=A0AA88IFZ9_ARTSF|nr:hypothetical protein QYM36_000821 [Artemia franciscana]
MRTVIKTQTIVNPPTNNRGSQRKGQTKDTRLSRKENLTLMNGYEKERCRPVKTVDLSHCVYCKKDFVCKKWKQDAKRHKQTKAHEENKKAWITSSSKTMPLSLYFSGDSKIERVATVEAKLVTFLVEHDLPYSLSEDLLKLVKNQTCYNIMAEVIDIDQEYEDGDKDSDDSEPSNKQPRITKKRADQRYKTE